MRIPLHLPEIATGLEPFPPPPPNDKTTKQKDRELGGDVTLVNDDKGASGEYPSLACGTDGCFVAWQGPTGGVSVAVFDSEKGLSRWHKKFAANGNHPSLGAGPDGAVAV